MKILIVEGIATSGKSSLIKIISSRLGRDKVKVYGEPVTHIPIMDKTDDLHIEFFKSLIQEAIRNKAELIIFDRFHLTQVSRAKENVDKYREIEDLLLGQTTLVVYLWVDEDAIANRVKLATEHRDKSWGEYIKTKGKSFDKIAQYYLDQQGSQQSLLKQSKLEFRIFNTTGHDYETIGDKIISEWFNKA